MDRDDEYEDGSGGPHLPELPGPPVTIDPSELPDPPPPPLLDTFHKARKQLGLYSALLLAWVLVGMNPDGEFLKERTGIDILHPERTPYVLMALILYFGFRLNVEWYQSSEARRQLAVSRVDYWVAAWIAVIAQMMYLVGLAYNEYGLSSTLGVAYTLLLVVAVAASTTTLSVERRLQIRRYLRSRLRRILFIAAVMVVSISASMLVMETVDIQSWNLHSPTLKAVAIATSMLTAVGTLWLLMQRLASRVTRMASMERKRTENLKAGWRPKPKKT